MSSLSPDLIIFDFDGVLCASETFTVDAIRDGLRGFAELVGVPVEQPSDAVLLNTLGYSSHDSYPPLLPAAVRDRWREMHRLTLDAMVRRVREMGRWGCLYPEIPALLDDLRADGRRLALASNCSTRYWEVHREVHELDRWFSQQWHLQSSGISHKGQMVERILAADPPQRGAVLVGDRASDAAAARNNGLPLIASAYGFGSPEEWPDAAQVVADRAELRRALGL
ncbi:MAG TPA: hypothetical protein DCZ72_02205 [Armatimonadetes bacterium]|nr:hypothetical protein [Armatimonadota bacterium]